MASRFLEAEIMSFHSTSCARPCSLQVRREDLKVERDSWWMGAALWSMTRRLDDTRRSLRQKDIITPAGIRLGLAPGALHREA